MAKSIADIIKQSRVGIEDVDVRYWAQRYIEELLGGGVRCGELKGGCLVLVAESASLRQELYLLRDDISEAVQENTGYKVSEVVVRSQDG